MGTYEQDRREVFAFLAETALPMPKTVSLLTTGASRHGSLRLPDGDVRGVDAWLSHFGVKPGVHHISGDISWISYGHDHAGLLGAFRVNVWSCIHTDPQEADDV